MYNSSQGDEGTLLLSLMLFFFNYEFTNNKIIFIIYISIIRPIYKNIFFINNLFLSFAGRGGGGGPPLRGAGQWGQPGAAGRYEGQGGALRVQCQEPSGGGAVGGPRARRQV